VKVLQPLNDEGRLKLLDLSGTNLTDPYIPSLYSLDTVQMIDLTNTKVTDSAVERLEEALPNCVIQH
jgi:hypothetical protein